MLKFPSIDSFRHAVATVKRACGYHNLPLPKIEYAGTVKLHGTNAGIHVDLINGTLVAQSRERPLSLEEDNYGFARWVSENHDALKRYFLEAFVEFGNVFTVYGEWIGPGIAKGVAINQFSEKQFVIMSVAFDDTIEFNEETGETKAVFYSVRKIKAPRPPRVHVITDVEPVILTVDFAQPDLAIDKLTELTQQYEDQCPFGALHGFEGIGEGLVWSPTDIDTSAIVPDNIRHRLWFKTKGEKHGNKGTSQKVKVLVAAENIADFNELLETVCPVSRMQQGFDLLEEQPPTRKSTGLLIKWAIGDTAKEAMDIVEESDFDWDTVARGLTDYIRRWYFTKV